MNERRDFLKKLGLGAVALAPGAGLVFNTLKGESFEAAAAAVDYGSEPESLGQVYGYDTILSPGDTELLEGLYGCAKTDTSGLIPEFWAKESLKVLMEEEELRKQIKCREPLSAVTNWQRLDQGETNVRSNDNLEMTYTFNETTTYNEYSVLQNLTILGMSSDGPVIKGELGPRLAQDDELVLRESEV